ncbi:MAG: LysR family transcriptional regulator [Methylococcales bacterium]|jgi:DNA-binding transcriptional LysR family regulator|nr:LysR family transcriptional regulator [Methylococcales bacterium]
MDKITGMTIFTRVAKLGSFTAAADELSMSRAMVSKHIMSLENRLGIRLLNRTTRRLSLTEVGRAYLERCLVILEEIEETEASVTQLQSEPKGILRISAPPFFGSKQLVPAIIEYGRQFPDVQFELILHGGLVDMIEENIDLAIRLDDLRDSSLVARNVGLSKLILCGSPDYFRKNGVPSDPEELNQHNCLVSTTLPPGAIWSFRDGETEKKIRVEGSLQSNIAGAIRSAVIGGMGLAILPSYMVGEELRKGLLQQALTEQLLASVAIQAVYPHRKFLSAKVSTFVNFLARRLAPQPSWDPWLNKA